METYVLQVQEQRSVFVYCFDYFPDHTKFVEDDSTRLNEGWPVAETKS